MTRKEQAVDLITKMPAGLSVAGKRRETIRRARRKYLFSEDETVLYDDEGKIILSFI